MTALQEVLRQLSATDDLPLEEKEFVARSQRRVRHTMAWLARRHLAGARVLEIGLGTIGVCCRAAGATVDAWDIRSVWTAVARKRHIGLVHTDLSDPGWQPPDVLPYDYIICGEVIEHIPVPPATLLKKISRVMKPGGAIVLTTPNLARLSNRARMLMGRPLFASFNAEALHMGHFREYTLNEVCEFVRAADLNVVECRPVNFDMGRYWPLRLFLAPFSRLANIIWVVAEAPAAREALVAGSRSGAGVAVVSGPYETLAP